MIFSEFFFPQEVLDQDMPDLPEYQAPQEESDISIELQFPSLGEVRLGFPLVAMCGRRIGLGFPLVGMYGKRVGLGFPLVAMCGRLVFPLLLCVGGG